MVLASVDSDGPQVHAAQVRIAHSLRDCEVDEINILLVEDNPGDSRLVEEMLAEVRDPPFRVQTVGTLAAALRAVRDTQFDAALFDLGLPDASGVTGLREFSLATSGLPIVVLTGLDCDDASIQAFGCGAQDYVVKGEENAKALRRALRYAIERKKLEASLERAAQYDSLTGLAGRALFHDRLEHAVARARREGGRFALLYVDLDRFKPINDIHGHQVGDLVLRCAANRIHKHVREADTAARIGGDEFAVILESPCDAPAAFEVASKLAARLARPLQHGNGQLQFGASIGIAVFPDHAASAADLLACADAAMYCAKHSGGDQAQLYGRCDDSRPRPLHAHRSRTEDGCPPLTALLVEGNAGDARLVEMLLDTLPEKSCDFVRAVSLRDALSKLDDASFDVVLLGLGLPDAADLEGLKAIAQAAPETPILLMTGRDERPTALDALHDGADDFVVKGKDDARTLHRAMEFALQRRRARHSIQQASDAFEQRLQVRTRTLQSTVSELEAFNRSVVRELRAPVRALTEMAAALVREGDCMFDTQTRQSLLRIRSEAQRIERLIDGVHELSRLSRAELTLETVDLANLGRFVFDALRRTDHERRTSFDAPESVLAFADRDLMLIALQNLIENAWRSTRGSDAKTIVFAAEYRDGERVFTIGEGSFGIDGEAPVAGLGTCERLPAQDVFSGIGVGLAAVKRIVERHGGRVWAEPRPGARARMCFTLG